jgi:hypothetical protein
VKDLLRLAAAPIKTPPKSAAFRPKRPARANPPPVISITVDSATMTIMAKVRKILADCIVLLNNDFINLKENIELCY